MNNENVFPVEPILLVDDDADILHSFYMTLKAEGINNVEKCLDSREVMVRLRQKRYSMVLLDILMPYLPGDVLLPQILKEYPDIKILMLTAVDVVKIAVECVHVGAKDYLQKPVEENVLIKRILNILKES